jgi:hypothetical protein
MDLIPHIDIIEPARIQALLDDPRNFSWNAIDSETLDTWTPDLGVTGYPNPSVFRPSGIAKSGLSSTLRHRFWGTVEHQSDHTGTRYIGILMYDMAGETCPMELRLASNDIGRIEPTRHDNRLHLIVVDKPVEFIGEMEIFQLIAPAQGTYRIEQFVLLHERPVPSRFLPTIENLTVRTTMQLDNLWHADLHFITSEVAKVDIDIADHEQFNSQIKQTDPARLHHIQIPDLQSDRTYSATITACELSGETVSETIEFTTARPTQTIHQETIAPVELINLNHAPLAGFPMTLGVPLAKGTVFNVNPCILQIGQERFPAQARVLSRWSDESVRWALIDVRVPARLGDVSTVESSIHFNLDNQMQPNNISVQIHATEWQITTDKLRVKIQSGALSIDKFHNHVWQTVLHPSELAFDTVLGNGVQLSASKIRDVVIEETGDQRTVVQFAVYHEDKKQVAHLKSTIRLHMYTGHSFVRLNHRLEVISPSLAPSATGGDLPDDLDNNIRAAIVGTTGEESTLLKLRSFSINLQYDTPNTVYHDDQSWDVGDQLWQLRHDHDLAYIIGDQVQDGHTVGHIQVEGKSGLFGVGLKHFWQMYPKALVVDNQTVHIQLFPERSGEDLPGDDDAWHRLYFWMKDNTYILKSGMALTNDIVLDFGIDNAAVFDWLEQGIIARPDIDYVNRIGVLNPIASRQDSILPDYETLTDQALASFHEDREHFRAYGQVNFGDWYGESGWSWGNNEYDPAYCAYIEFLRGGDPHWALWGAESVRHLVDVDTVNFSSDAHEIGGQAMHMPGHLGGYLPPLFRSKMAGTKSIPSHIWVEGALLHYLISGDESVHDSIEKTKQWLLQKHWFDHYDFSNCRESGWHIIHLCMLATATNDNNCLNAATIIVQRVLERAEPDGGWVRMLTESHCGCGYPRCRGEAGFMVGVLLSGLKRYYNLTDSADVANAIVGGARWLIRYTFDHDAGHFRYTSCKNRTLGGTFQQTQWVLEGLADAYEISGDAEIGSFVSRGLKSIGLFPEGITHLGMGKAMSQQMRYVPTVLAALQERPLEET